MTRHAPKPYSAFTLRGAQCDMLMYDAQHTREHAERLEKGRSYLVATRILSVDVGQMAPKLANIAGKKSRQ